MIAHVASCSSAFRALAQYRQLVNITFRHNTVLRTGGNKLSGPCHTETKTVTLCEIHLNRIKNAITIVLHMKPVISSFT
jgi:hypothetical protein